MFKHILNKCEQLVRKLCYVRFILLNLPIYRAKLVNNPPAQFTQNYYSCYPLPLPSFQTAVGIASGNTALSLPVLVFMLLPIIYFFMLKLKQVLVILLCLFVSLRA